MLLATVSFLSQAGNTMLIAAASAGKTEIVKLLLKAGASIDQRGRVSQRHRMVWCDTIILSNVVNRLL